jgi:hypothetical protein
MVFAVWLKCWCNSVYYSIHFPGQNETPTSDTEITLVYIPAWRIKTETIFTTGKTRKETALHRVLVSRCDLLTALCSFNFTVIQASTTLMKFLPTNPDVSTFCVWICKTVQPHPQPTHCSQILSYLMTSRSAISFHGNHTKAICRIYAYINSKVSCHIGNIVPSFSGIFYVTSLLLIRVFLRMLHKVDHSFLECDAV